MAGRGGIKGLRPGAAVVGKLQQSEPAHMVVHQIAGQPPKLPSPAQCRGDMGAQGGVLEGASGRGLVNLPELGQWDRRSSWPTDAAMQRVLDHNRLHRAVRTWPIQSHDERPRLGVIAAGAASAEPAGTKRRFFAGPAIHRGESPPGEASMPHSLAREQAQRQFVLSPSIVGEGIGGPAFRARQAGCVARSVSMRPRS